jgi:hypothetical protein
LVKKEKKEKKIEKKSIRAYPRTALWDFFTPPPMVPLNGARPHCSSSPTPHAALLHAAAHPRASIAARSYLSLAASSIQLQPGSCHGAWSDVGSLPRPSHGAFCCIASWFSVQPWRSLPLVVVFSPNA